MAQNEKWKLHPSCAMRHITGTVKHIIMISDTMFFSIFKNLISYIVRRVKGQKMAQNDKKISPSRTISQEPYIIWSSFLILCKVMISPGVFFIFSKFWFFRLLGGGGWVKGEKMTQKLPISVRQAPYFRSCRSYHLDFLLHKCKIMTSQGAKISICHTLYFKNSTRP